MPNSDELELVKIVTYKRMSLDTQEDAYGLEEQLQLFCEVQGFEVVGRFEDIDSHGVVDEDVAITRPGIQNLLADLKDHPVKYIVVLSTSHLWGSDTAQILIQQQLRRHKVDVKAIDHPTYSIYRQDKGLSSSMVSAILQILDSHDRLDARLKLLRGRRRKAAQGGFAGGRAAFGYADCTGSRVLEVNEEQAVAVRRVFSLRSQYPDWTYQAIADQLNLEGHKTARERPFGRQHVHAILSKREFYSGIYKYGSITTEGQHLPLI